MSRSAKQTPLGVNVLGTLLQDQGFTINPNVIKFVGSSKVNASYTPGSLVSSTCLNTLTSAINLAYTNNMHTSYASTYDNLIKIGLNTIPALGNAKPNTYDVIDPRVNSSNKWTGVATTGYYLAGNTGQGQEATWLPYDTSNPNVSVTQWGYIRLFALQAWNEFNWNGIPAGSGMPEYKDFCASFLMANGFVNSSSSVVNSTQNSKQFLKGTYSNMNDLISSDITGVTQSTAVFGRDCINLGKVIDLSKIYKFGMPSVLLQTIKQYNAFSQALSLALLSTGLPIEEIDSIANNTLSGITKLQEQKIYSAFLLITGKDLSDILIPLNCKTNNLERLADLLDLKKMFPNSYSTLTVPVYNINPGPTNSKTYYPIFENNGISSRLTSPTITSQIGTILLPDNPPVATTTGEFSVQKVKEGFDSYLDGILPSNLALAAGAFSFAMQQIRNIRNVEFEKFAQVVFTIETTIGLPNVNGTDIPVSLTLADQGLDLQALGSGPYGSYTMSDFFGCMSGLPYMWQEIQNDILRLQTTALINIYADLYQTIADLDITTTITDVQDCIDQANAEIAAILAAQPRLARRLNVAWDATGTQLTIEQRARWTAISPVASPTRNVWVNTFPASQNTFVDAITQLAQNTLPHMQAQTLEAISDLSLVGGQSIVALQRQERNQERLQKLGIELDNDIPDTLDLKLTKLLGANGTAPIAKAGQGITVQGLNGTDEPAVFTFPSMLTQINPDTSQVTSTAPLGYIDPNTSCYRPTNPCVGGQGGLTKPETTSPINELLNAAETNINNRNVLGPARNGTGPAVSEDIAAIIDNVTPIQSLTSLNQSTAAGLYNFNQVNPTPNIVINSIQIGDTTSPPPLVPIAVIRAGAVLTTGSGSCFDQGGPVAPGSLAGSPYTDLVPPNLSPLYFSNTLLQSITCVPEAIDDVIKCNCDCWVD